LYRLDVAGRRLTRLTEGRADRSPAWSRDGKRIAFLRRSGKSERLFVVNRDGSGLQPVGRVSATSTSWGPGDNEIAIGNGSGIWVIRPNGTGLRRLYSSRGVGAIDQPAWSPDGQTILFSVAGVGLLAIGADGRGAHVIVKRPKPTPNHLYTLRAPAWAPNGTRISYLQTDLFSITTGPRIRTASPDGRQQRTVTTLASAGFQEAVPTWSPDSRWIAFADLRGDVQGVFEVAGGGGKPRLLFGGRSGTIWSEPNWTPPRS
jgi:Tol biopolymer transport system component